MASLGELREALTALGLSTSTGSLRGEERRATLERRLHDGRVKLGLIAGETFQTDPSVPSNESAVIHRAVPRSVEAFRPLSLSELRAELEARSLTTQTPGLKGEARRHALIQRLQNAGTEPQVRGDVGYQPDQSDGDVETLKSSRSSASSYSAASEFFFFDTTKDIAQKQQPQIVPALQFSPSNSDAVTKQAPSAWSSPSFASSPNVRAELERELIGLRKQLHGLREHRSLNTSRRLHEAGFDQNLDQLASRMARLESERQRLLRVAFGHELVATTTTEGNPIELIQEDAIKLIETHQHALRRQIECIKEAIRLSTDNQEAEAEEAKLMHAIGQIELQLQNIGSSRSCSSSASRVSSPTPGVDDVHSMPVLTRCRSLPSSQFHEAWNELDESQKLQLRQELQASKSFHIRRDRVCLGNPSATSRDGHGSSIATIAQQKLLAFSRYPPSAADKLGIKALFLEQSQRNVSEIHRVYQLALAAEPGHAVVLGNYARFLHEKCRDNKQAEAYFTKALRADPLCGSTLASYGFFLHHSQRDYDQAEQLYAQAVELLPRDPLLAGNYASLLRKRANGNVSQLEQAKQLLVRSLEIDTCNVTNRLRLCAVLEDLSDRQGALLGYEQLIQQVENVFKRASQSETPRTERFLSERAHVYGNFANFLRRSGSLERAKRMYEMALRLHPDDALLKRNFSLLLRDYKRSPRAETPPQAVRAG